MKIMIDKNPHNWYLMDLHLYTTEFLIEIIQDLYAKRIRSGGEE